MRYKIITIVILTILFGIVPGVAFAETECTEILWQAIPVRHKQPCLILPCVNHDVFAKCECQYGDEDGLIQKVTFSTAAISTDNLKRERIKLLTWISGAFLMQDADSVSTADYASFLVTNSWGESAYVNIVTNHIEVTVDNINTSRRLSSIRDKQTRFPAEFMGFRLDCPIGEGHLHQSLMSVFAGANKGKYAYYKCNICCAATDNKFFERGVCYLSFKTKNIFHVSLERTFEEAERDQVIKDFLEYSNCKYGFTGIETTKEPFSGKIYSGAKGFRSDGISARFKIEKEGSSDRSTLTAFFDLPAQAYDTLLAEGKY